MKSNLKKLYILISRVILPLFYDKKYLTGRWFQNTSKGYQWAWRNFFFQKVIGFNKHVPWPVSHRSVIGNPQNLKFHVDDLGNFQHFGCYYQCYSGKIKLGKGTYIAPNVGLITANHDPLELDKHLDSKDIIIGENCWVGMNSTILPGVKLGPNTIVGAGSVVTKSFVSGKCILAGNPAKKIRDL
ncbi:acyltransferase [Thalassobacillus pellis]|uniref:acyltransferase n=1 Tax=Thalassobacillus pellis TaxID=748008 RepID=UPI00195F86DC|nr:acyltransferase [Thalassobacillus pellis]MBM7551659.1 acetyltransferase-like isoleucine patch superfamily enzyme [Thalassobacillus pellis]